MRCRSRVEAPSLPLSFLDDHGEPLIHGAEEHPEAPGIHFVGYQVTLDGMFRRVGIQAKQLARSLA
jgi:putative flavoprotein involved in K+ transport